RAASARYTSSAAIPLVRFTIPSFLRWIRTKIRSRVCLARVFFGNFPPMDSLPWRLFSFFYGEETMTATSASLTIPVSIAKDLLTGAEWGSADTRDHLQRTAEIKARPSRYASVLRNKHIALIFEKPSLRTRVTFEVGIQSMGGFVVFLDHTQARLGERESIPDVARNLERWVQGIVARVYEQRVLEEMAAN